ncbi:MAG: hypothetical protein LBF22_03445 [Deltaproteobacteria bacterium]|nr:hypothetical protein [Deltaproteobacteria bacterium]
MTDKEICEKYGFLDNFSLSSLNTHKTKSRRPLGKPCARNWHPWFAESWLDPAKGSAQDGLFDCQITLLS